jgi:hypothetical protein
MDHRQRAEEDCMTELFGVGVPRRKRGWPSVGLRPWADHPAGGLSPFGRRRLLVARALARHLAVVVSLVDGTVTDGVADRTILLPEGVVRLRDRPGRATAPRLASWAGTPG